MSLDTIKTAIRQLSYTDMKTLADELGTALQMTPIDDHTRDEIATALLSLPVGAVTVGVAALEDEYFQRAFSRKRMLTIHRYNGKGWQVDCGTISGVSATHPSLREAISRVLDTIVGLKALE